MKCIAVFVTVMVMSMSGAFAADQTVPLATMTCKQFVDSPKDTVSIILAWMMGYNQDSDEPAEINLTKMDDFGKKLSAYCRQNPTHGVMQAMDKVSDASDSVDAPEGLKSFVGTWTFQDKQVWVVVKSDGSAIQCRVGPDGTVYFSKGAFRAPSTLAWDKIWGNDEATREKDTITLTGKFGSFSYRLDNGGQLSDKCPAA